MATTGLTRQYREYSQRLAITRNCLQMTSTCAKLPADGLYRVVWANWISELCAGSHPRGHWFKSSIAHHLRQTAPGLTGGGAFLYPADLSSRAAETYANFAAPVTLRADSTRSLPCLPVRVVSKFGCPARFELGCPFCTAGHAAPGFDGTR